MRWNHQYFQHLMYKFIPTLMFVLTNIWDSNTPFLASKMSKLANLTSAPFRGCFLFTPHMPNHLQTLMRCLDQGAPFLLTFHVGYSQSARWSGTRCCRLSTCSSTAAQLLNLAAAANHSLLGGIKKVFPLSSHVYYSRVDKSVFLIRIERWSYWQGCRQTKALIWLATALFGPQLLFSLASWPVSCLLRKGH